MRVKEENRKEKMNMLLVVEDFTKVSRDNDWLIRDNLENQKSRFQTKLKEKKGIALSKMYFV
jgi:hypothetical protein